MKKVLLVLMVLAFTLITFADDVTVKQSLGANVLPVINTATWTGTGWITQPGYSTHSTGTTALYPSTNPVKIGVKYLLEYTISNISTGTITASCGGVSDSARSTNGNFSVVITTTAETVLAFTPTNTCDGTVSNVSLRPYEGGNIRAYGNIVSEGTTTAKGGFVGNLTGSVTGNVSVQLTYEYWVDAGRTDTYTADGSVLYPFLTLKAALDVINAKVAISPRTSYTVNLLPGTYSDNVTIVGGPQHLTIKGYGATISGTIGITPADDVYDRIEFVGVEGPRAEKGPALIISGAITLTKTNDSLKYISFKGCSVTGAMTAGTGGTWVCQYENCKVTGAITGTLASYTGGAGHQDCILIETYGLNEFATGAITGIVSFYNCNGSTFYNTINTTPHYENRFTHCTFSGNTISIIPKVTASSVVIYGDANSLTSFKARTPTVTGATYSNIDACGMLADAQTWSGVQTAGIIQPASIYNSDGSETLDATMSGKTVVCTKSDGTTTITIPVPAAGTVGVVYEIVQTADRQVDVVCTTADSNGIVADGVATSDQVSLATASHLIGGGIRLIGIQTAASTYKWFATAMSPTEPLTVEAAD